MAVSCAVVFVGACGDDSGKSGPESFVGESAEALVQAEKGGALAVGAVKVKVPSGALEKDTLLTVKVQSKKQHPQQTKVAIDVYEFGPKGTTFSKDVELEFDLKGVTIDKKHRAEVAELDEEAGTWKVLASSKVQGGKVRANTKHFSFYTVLLTEVSDTDGVILCDADYSPCGGELQGTWEFQSGCISAYAGSFGIPDTGSTGAVCDDTVSGVTLSVSGTATFGPDDAYAVDQTLVLDSSFSIAIACLDEISKLTGAPYTCDMLSGEITGGRCEQSTSSGDLELPSEGTYSTAGSDLTLVSADGPVVFGLGMIDPAIDYCVTGDTLTLRVKSEDAYNNQVYVATRVSAQ